MTDQEELEYAKELLSFAGAAIVAMMETFGIGDQTAIMNLESGKSMSLADMIGFIDNFRKKSN